MDDVVKLNLPNNLSLMHQVNTKMLFNIVR
jgi:hypothetical protein